MIYRQPELARRVNVDATVALLNAARSCARPPRFIQASSNAVHGARNPHRHHGLLREDTPLQPTDLYGAHKAEVEDHVRSSGLPWVILRLAGIMSVEPGAMPFSLDALFFESALPTEGGCTASTSATPLPRSPRPLRPLPPMSSVRSF